MPHPGSPTSSPLPEPAAWVTSLCCRLGFLQQNLPGETTENRATYLQAEMRRALQRLPASERGRYLEALMELAPDLDFGSPTAGRTADPPRLPDGEVALEALQSVLRLAAEDRLKTEAVGSLCAALIDLVITVDQIAWTVWRNAAPKSFVRRDNALGELRMVLRRYALGDATVSTTQLQRQLESTRQLVAGLLAGLGQAGKNFARRYQQRFSPDAIQEAVRAEGQTGWFGKSTTECWKKYLELTMELTNTTIEKDVQESVVKYAEDLIRGAQRKETRPPL